MAKESAKEIEVNTTYLEWILEAIHKIKYQKQRPGLDRISNAVRQNHSVSKESIEEQLELAVKNDKIVKVFSCDAYTYKDPSMAPGVPPPPKGYIPGRRGGGPRSCDVAEHLKKNDFVKAVIQCLKETKESKGMTIKDMEKYILSKNDNGNSAGVIRNVKISVRKALQKGQLAQNGKFIILPKGSKTIKTPTSSETAHLEIILPFERHRVSF